jgi:hypothetical protein
MRLPNRLFATLRATRRRQNSEEQTMRYPLEAHFESAGLNWSHNPHMPSPQQRYPIRKPLLGQPDLQPVLGRAVGGARSQSRA